MGWRKPNSIFIRICGLVCHLIAFGGIKYDHNIPSSAIPLEDMFRLMRLTAFCISYVSVYSVKKVPDPVSFYFRFRFAVEKVIMPVDAEDKKATRHNYRSFAEDSIAAHSVADSGNELAEKDKNEDELGHIDVSLQKWFCKIGHPGLGCCIPDGGANPHDG